MNTFNLESIKSISPLFLPSNGGILKIFATEADQITEISIDNNKIQFNFLSATEIQLNVGKLESGPKKINFKTASQNSFEKENAFIAISPITVNYLRNSDSGKKKVLLSRDEKIILPKTGGSFSVFGSGFDFIKSIKIDDSDIYSFDIISDSELKLTTPALNSGKKTSLTITNIAGDKTDYTIDVGVENNAPTINSVSPNSKNADALTLVTVLGSNFDSDFLQLKVGNEIQKIKGFSPSSITFEYSNKVPGPKDVSVQTTNGTAILKNAFLIFVSPNISNISTRSVSQNGGAQITISGTNLIDFNSVILGDETCQIVSKDYSTIVFISPAFASAGYKTLTIASPTLTITEQSLIEVVAEPVIYSVFPNELSPNSPQEVTIFGTDLLNIQDIGGMDASQFIDFVAYNNFSGQATIYPTQSGSGIQSVTTTSTMGQVLTTPDLYTYTAQNPIIERVSPSITPIDNLSVNQFGETYKLSIYAYVFGKNLLPNPIVKIDGQQAEVLSSASYGSFGDVLNINYPTNITGYADVQVITQNRTGVLKSGVLFVNRPFVSAIYPSYSWSGGGDFITIEGENLSGCNVFIEQGKFTNQTFEPAYEVKSHGSNQISFFTIPGSGGCQGEYMGNCLDPKGEDGPRIIKISGPGGDCFYSGVDYLSEPKITSAYQTGFDINYGQLPSDTIVLQGNINLPNDPVTWNSFDGTPVKFFPGDEGTFSQSVTPKINGVKLQILPEQSSTTGLVCKIPYLQYSLSGSNKTLLGVTEVYSPYSETGYSGDYNYDAEGEMAYVDSLFLQKVNFMSGVAKTLQTGLSGGFSTPSANQSFNQKISNLLNSFATPENFFGYANFNSITGDAPFQSIINSGLVRFLPTFRWASGVHFSGSGNGGVFTGNHQDFYNIDYPFYYIYRTGNFAQFESGNITEIVTTGIVFSGYAETSISSGLSASLLNRSSFINSLETFNENPVFIDKHLAYKIWYYNGVSEKDHSIDDWYDTSYSFDGWNQYGQGNPTPQPAQLKKIEPLKYVKKATVRLDNGTNYQVGPGYLAGISTPNVLSFSLPSNAKIGTLIRVEIGQLGYNCTTSIVGFLEVDCDGCMYPGSGPARPNAKEKGPFTFLKTKNGWNIIHFGNYQKTNSALNTGVSPGWIISPEVGELNFSWVKRKDSFDNAYFGNYIPNTISQNSSGNIYVEEKTNEIINNGIFDSYNVLQVKSDNRLLNHEQSISFLPFVPPYIGAISTRTTGSNNVPSPNYGPLEFSEQASGVYNGGYTIDLSGFFQKTAGISEVFIGEQKVAQFNSASFGGTPPYGSTSQDLLSIQVTGFSFEQLGTFDVTIKNNAGEHTLPNAFTVFEIPQRGATTIQATALLPAPTAQVPAIYPISIDLNQDNIPDSWDNQYFPNSLNFDTFRITGFSNAPGETATHNSPNAIYLKTPSYQSVFPQVETTYYYESGRQTNSKGPNFVLCGGGECILFLAPKNVSPYTSLPYDPVTSPVGALSFLKAFGKGLTPTPWNRNWKYAQPQAGYITGTVSPVFTSPVNHHSADSDNDGQRNVSEFIFGTNPTTGTSKYSPSYTLTGGFFNFFVPTIQNRRYFIQTGNLINWVNAAVITGDGFTKQFSVPTAGGNLFLRARVEVLHRAPSISSIFPNKAKLTNNGQGLINGSNLETVKSISLGGVNVTDFEVESSSRVFFKVPDMASSGSRNLIVTNESGSVTGLNMITYYNPPIVSSITPDKFPMGGGSTTVRGSGFYNPVSAEIENGDTVNVSSLTLTGFNTSIPTQFSQGLKNLVVKTPGGEFKSPIEIIGATNITSISPTSGPIGGGGVLNVQGSNFVQGYTKLFIQTEPNSIQYQELPITSFTERSSITASIPTSASAGCRNIKVETFSGASISILNKAYCYLNVPTIQSINPSTGNTNGFQTVLISGSNFDSNTEAFIDNRPISNKVFVSSLAISGRTPTGTNGFKNVTVSGFGNLTSTLTGGYRYASSPVINSISPSCIRTGTAPTILISGRNLLSGSNTKITIGGISSAAISNFSETGLTVVAPSFSNGGSVNVFVDTDAGRSNTFGISYLARPSNLNVNPASAPLTGRLNVTLYGTNLGSANCPPSLKIGSNLATIKSFTDTEISFDAPTESAGFKNVEVSNIGGTGTINNGFMYLMPPTISTITPNQGSPLGGNLIEISGSGLLTSPHGGGISTRVFLNDSEASILNLIGSVNASSRFRVIAPAQTNKNTIDIRFENPGGTTTVLNAYAYTSPMAINSFLPSGGPLNGGNTFIASGSNIPSDVTVKFGSTTATNITVISNTGISGRVPSTSSIGLSTVTITGGGMPAITRNYAYLGQPIITSINPSVGPSDFNQIPLTLNGSRFTLPNSNVNYNSTLKIGDKTAQIVSISENSVTANLNEFITPTGAKNVTFSNLGGTGILTGGYTGVTYMPTYSMPTYVGTGTLFTTSNVNTLYVTYQP